MRMMMVWLALSPVLIAQVVGEPWMQAPLPAQGTVGLQIEQDLQFAYDDMWRGVSQTRSNPSVQGAFTVGFPGSMFAEQLHIYPYFKMLIANLARAESDQAAAYEQKVFRVNFAWQGYRFGLSRVLHFTLGDSDDTPTWPEQAVIAGYQWSLPAEGALLTQIRWLFPQSDMITSSYQQYQIDAIWPMWHIGFEWGNYPPHGRHSELTAGWRTGPYELGVKYAELDVNTAAIADGRHHDRRTYLFVRYHSVTRPDWLQRWFGV